MAVTTQRMDFDTIEFARLIEEKGYDLLHYKSLRCSCVNASGQTALTCPICKNTGIRYLATPKKIKAILTGMTKDIEFGETGFSRVGAVNVTTYASNRLGYGDKLLLLNGKIIYSEVISDLNIDPELTYSVLDVDCVASLHHDYVKEVDYNIVDNKILWTIPPDEPYSIRYITYPVFLILNFPHSIRGTNTKLKQANITYVDLPMQAIAKLQFRVDPSELL